VSANWASAATGAQYLADLLAMIQKAYDDHMYGPFIIYVPLAAFTRMGDDFKTNSDKTIIQRLLEVPGVEDIVPTEELTGTNVLLVQMTKDVVDLIDGIQPTLVEWDSHGGMVSHFKVMAIMLPRVRNDYELQSGIVHYS
jgi:hypothetical protein